MNLNYQCKNLTISHFIDWIYHPQKLEKSPLFLLNTFKEIINFFDQYLNKPNLAKKTTKVLLDLVPMRKYFENLISIFTFILSLM